jgi:hypothetical protein
LELREATDSEFLLNAKNERLKAAQFLAEEQLREARSLLAKAEESREAARAESVEKASALVKLQEDFKAKIAQGVKREKELLSHIESELASRTTFEKAAESKMKFYEAKTKGLERHLD